MITSREEPLKLKNIFVANGDGLACLNFCPSFETTRTICPYTDWKQTMTNDNNDKEFETNDIYLAAFLKISGCQMIRRRRQINRIYFVFVNPAGSIQELRMAFFSGQAKVPAYQYSQDIIAFKQMCYDG